MFVNIMTEINKKTTLWCLEPGSDILQTYLRYSCHLQPITFYALFHWVPGISTPYLLPMYSNWCKVQIKLAQYSTIPSVNMEL